MKAPVEAAVKGTVIRALVGALGLLIVAVLLIDWNSIAWQGGRQGTADAQLRGDPVMIMSQVSGYVTRVLVDDDQPVRRGQVLYEIESDSYRAVLNGAAAAAAEAEAGVHEIEARIALAREQAETATDTAQESAANLIYAREEKGRWDTLAGTEGALLRQQQQADAEARRQNETLEADRHAIGAAKDEVASLQAQLKTQLAMLAMRRHQAELADINLRWTRILAPADGVVSQRWVRPGEFVTAGRLLIHFVPLPDVWVVAYYREEQVTDMRIGQAADIHVDAYPDQTFHGHVDSFGPNVQNYTQLLPADRATGNFTKVVQRVPIKIVFDAPMPLATRLIPGLNVETYVHTGGQTRPLEAR